VSVLRVALITALLSTVAASAFATRPRAPVEVSILPVATVTAPPHAGVTISLRLSVTNPRPIRVVVFVRPVSGQPVIDAKVSDETLPISESLTRAVTIPVLRAGDFRVNVIAEEPGGGVSDGASAVVRLSEEATVEVLTPAAFNGLRAARARTSPLRAPNGTGPDEPNASIVVGSGTLSDEKPHSISKSDDVQGSTKYLTLTGTISTRVNGVNVPMANVTMQVWDSDTVSPDDLLGTTMTDANGNYSITVVNGDGPFGGGVDVYLYVYSKYANTSMIQLVPDGEGGFVPFNYAWRSPTVGDITSPTYAMNFGITDQAEEAAAWMGASRATYLVNSSTGRTLSYVEVRYPGLQSGTFFNPSAGFINIDPNDSDSPETVAHEYAHAVMYQAYGTVPGEGGTHEYCHPASPGLAWSEGFATGVGLVVGNGNGIDHWHVGDTGLSIENWSCNLRVMSTDEGRVAAAFWDLYDAANDANGGNPDRGMNAFSDTNQGTALVTFGQLLRPLG